MAMKVWIDQDLCTGDGICVEIASPLFGMHDDGLAYVKEASWASILNGGSGPALVGPNGVATVPDGTLAEVVEAAEECPGECIFLEVG
jgi:ferredoxin